MSKTSIADEEALLKQQVEYVVLSGGGAKGALYTGVHKALSDSGVLNGVKGIAGSSAGAVSAAFIATGMSPEEFKRVSDAHNFGDLLGKGIIPIKSIPLQKDGMPLYELLDRQIRTNISSFLEKHDILELAHKRSEEITKEREISDRNLAEKMSALIEIENKIKNFGDNNLGEGLPLLKDKKSELETDITTLGDKIASASKDFTRLKEIANNSKAIKDDLLGKCANGGKIYFKDLGIMHLLNPQKFKDLHITATQKNNGELKIFNAADSPDVEIALACKASSSIPRVFKSVKIDGITYVDGGFRSNVPYQAFDKKPSKNLEQTQNDVEDITNDKAKLAEAQRSRKTLAFVFADPSSKEALYSAKETIGDNPGKIRKFITAIINAISRKKQKDTVKNNKFRQNLLSKKQKLQQKSEQGIKLGFAEKVVSKVIDKILGVGGRSYSESLIGDYSGMRANSHNTVALDAKKVGTVGFKEVAKRKDEMHNRGYITAIEHLSNSRENSTTQDPNLPLQSFILQVYDEVEKTRPTKVWQRKVHGTSANQKDLLKFTTPEKWKDKYPGEVIQDYIISAMHEASNSRGQNGFSTETPAAKAMIKVLNDKTIPNNVKETFAEVLGKRSNEKPLTFEKKDLENFIKNPELLASKAQNISSTRG